GWRRFVEPRIAVPREDFRGPSRIIDAIEPDIVFASGAPYSLVYYSRPPDYVIQRPGVAGGPRRSDDPVIVQAGKVHQLSCTTDRTIVLLLYGDDADGFPTDCLVERGATVTPFAMRSRGGRVDVWVLDPAA